ncbi:hypothetical protein UCDDA912_g10768 [Diaporthe ampelina]|uniref:Uncharacterized protein n=1 Tax=Diaporthe ampelina TaxID=1214573 RepID=A0A0G2F4Z1_9PEZI|nr:hypothetical protein UCDDA912_g10768 [Diaporthe ampelina]
MAERRPLSLDLAALPCLVAWSDTEDGLARHLYRRDHDPTLQVALDLGWAEPGPQSTVGGGTFRLRVPVDLKACPHEKTPLFLYIRPGSIASVSGPSLAPDETPDHEDTQSGVLQVVRAKFGPQFMRLRFALDALPEMVVPSGVPIIPTKRRPHGEQISLLARLARARSFSVFLKDDGSLSPLLRRLADATSNPARTVQFRAGALSGMASLYPGRGAKILNSDGLSAMLRAAAPPLSLPPPYETVEAPPPPAPLDQEMKNKASASSHPRKRQRGNDGASHTNDSTCCSHEDCGHVSAAQFEQFRQEVKEALRQLHQQDDHAPVAGHVARFVTEHVESKIRGVRSEVMAEVQDSKTEVMAEVRKRTDDLQLQISDAVREMEVMDERVDAHVEDAILEAKVELEEKAETFQSDMEQLVTEQLDRLQESVLDEVAESVMERLSGATVTVEQAIVRLD